MTETSMNLIAEYYRLHLGELRAFVAKCTGGSAESEDIVQNVFLRLLNSGKMISAITLPCLVFSIARNLVADYWRHHKSVVQHETYVRMHVGESNPADEPSSVDAPAEITELLERGMARLSPKSRHIYAMNVMEGMRVAEISDTLGETYKSVENRLGAARKEIRSYMRRMLA